MRPIWLLLCLALIGCVATSALPFLSAWGTRPDIFLMFALTAAMKGRRDRAVWVAWGCGLAKDLCGHGPLGAHAALYLLAAAVVFNARPLFNVTLVQIQLGMTAAVCAVCQLLYAAVLFAFNTHMDPLAVLARATLITLLTTLLMPPFMVVTQRLIHFLRITSRPGYSHRHRLAR